MKSKLLILLASFCFCDGMFLYRYLKSEAGDGEVLKTEAENMTMLETSWTVNEVSRVYFDPRINMTGWAFLEVHTVGTELNSIQAYAAGFLEGMATADLIYMAWYNTMKGFCDGRQKICDKLYKFLEENANWMDQNIAKYGKTDPYWEHVDLVRLQIVGIAEGYQKAVTDPSKNLTLLDIRLMNLSGDLEDLMEALAMEEKNYSDEDYLPLSAQGKGHCSALIKVLPDGSDIFVSQVTWNTYGSMIRIQKKYVMPLKKLSGGDDLVPGIATSFSSYPGSVSSGDDFYLISSNLATLETTIGNGNPALWKYVKPNSVFEFYRSIVANRLATNGESWTNIFSEFNSGTYNNQWMVVDYNLFKQHYHSDPKNLPNNLLWILEQIPGFIQAEDVTSVLRETTYWASYNVAYFPKVYNMSGNEAMVKKFGDWFTYDKNPRALIFKRDHVKVKDVDSMYKLMRYNDYKHDPLSKCDCNPPYSAENAISARCDLNPVNGTYPFPALGHRQHGATDAKITCLPMFDNGLTFMSVSGPTYNEKLGIPPFQWSTSDFEPSTSHLGHPDYWNFLPLVQQWL